MEPCLFQVERAGEEFKRRNLSGFERAIAGCIRGGISQAAFVIHGGTIMNLMEEYADIQKPFYEWHVKNGGGYETVLEEDMWERGRKELSVKTAIMED